MREPFKLITPPQIRCPFKCNKGWVGEPDIREEDGTWTGESQCAGCGAYSLWDFDPGRPLAEQKLWVKESYEGFWEGPQ